MQRLLGLWASALSMIAFTMVTKTEATGLDPSGYALYSSSGDVSLGNLSSTSIAGNVRSEADTCTFNNLNSLSITGNVVCLGTVRFNNISTGQVTGVVQSVSSVTIPRGFNTGGSSVVNSISPLTMSTLSAPTSDSDGNYLLPIQVVSGDYTINNPIVLNGTIYATGDIHINNGNISGTGTLVAGGGIHLNNLSSVGSSSTKLFLYALGNAGVDTNNISSLNIQGTVYSPNGQVKMNNISTLTVSGGIFGKTLNLNNITSLTLGSGSVMSSAMPPGITTPVTAPAAPSSLVAAAASFTSIGLTWTDNSNNETAFKIERSSDGGSTFTEIASIAANTRTYLNDSLSTNRTYHYRVRAYNSAGYSAYTNVAFATLLSPPNAPTNLVATVTGSTIHLDWADNSENEDTFLVERATDGISFTEIASTHANDATYTDPGLGANTYTYRVRARNSAGTSGYTNIASGMISSGGTCDPNSADAGYSSDDQGVYVATVEQCGMLLK
jgi:hypothetical protein